MSIFGSGWIRGPYGERVTADFALSLGRVLATAHGGPIVVGRDHRDSSPPLAEALSVGVRECGVDVVDLGRVPAPTLARAIPWYDGSIGVMVTGGHNRPEVNGFELRSPSGRPFDATQRHHVTERLFGDEFEHSASGFGTVEDPPVPPADRHREALLDAVSLPSALDVAVHVESPAGRITAETLEDLGCTVVALDATTDRRGTPGSSAPESATCDPLQRFVAATEADLGIAHDSAASRTMAVTESGELVPGDTLLAMFARRAVSDDEEVVVPVDTSIAVESEVERAGGTVLRTEVGASYVANRASDAGVAFAGEPSGGWIWPEEAAFRDGPLAACKLAAMVAEQGSLDALLDGVTQFPLRRETVQVDSPGDVLYDVRERAREEYGEGAVSSIDGIHVDRDDGWFLVRASGTEAVIRVTAEAESQDRVDHYLDRATDLVRSVTATV